ncbi:MAG: hypothetical protein DRH97_07845 [Chloroflexi bacterium]|nr:MAG: hypothetical protein DRH97_07845 [Chloroflexota bacterium]
MKKIAFVEKGWHDVTFSSKKPEGSVVKEFETQKDFEAYIAPIISGEKKIDLQGEGEARRVVRVSKNEAEILADETALIEARKAELLLSLKQFDNDILKCSADQLVFSEKYPEQAAKRQVILTELNSL